MNTHELKSKIIREADALGNRLFDLAMKMYKNPELGMEEKKASKWLCDELRHLGFKTLLGVAGLKTAFKADYFSKSKAPSIGFIAEYDALPDIGHGCGHILIGPAAIGAAAVLKKVMPKGSINVSVFGTPAEESVGGKVPMLQKGVFNKMDVVMMIHPHTMSTAFRPCIGRICINFEFFGRIAHAAAFPHQGINALDAMILTFNNINALRQQLRSDVRIHGIIVAGGKVANVIPDYTKAEFQVRAMDAKYMSEVEKKVIDCAKGAAKATGTKLKISYPAATYLPDKPIRSLIECFEKNEEQLGLEITHLKPPFQSGSTDFGNVSQKIPALLGYMEVVPKGTPSHSVEFGKAAASSKGKKGLLDGIKAMAMTAVDIVTEPGLLQKIQKEFKSKEIWY